MVFKKSLSVALIISQVAFGWTAFAESKTPETVLLSQVIALSGQNLSPQQLQTEVSEKLAQYGETAPVEGRAARTEEALVSLGIYSPAQVQALEAQVQSMGDGLSQEAFTSQLLSVASQAAGAQFSGCAESVGIAVLGGALLWVSLHELSTVPGQFSPSNQLTPPSAGRDNFLVGWGIAANIGALGLLGGVFFGVFGGQCS